MILTLDNLDGDSIYECVMRRASSFFKFSKVEEEQLATSLPRALARLEACLAGNSGRYYGVTESEVHFDVLNTDHFCTFLYFLANELHRQNPASQAQTKISYLNKILHGIDLFHFIELPSVFKLGHPVGTVLGRATYGENLSITQGVTIGSNRGKYPVIGHDVSIHPGAMILGNCNIGPRVRIAAGSLILDRDIPSDSLVVGRHPNLRIIPLEISIPESNRAAT